MDYLMAQYEINYDRILYDWSSQVGEIVEACYDGKDSPENIRKAVAKLFRTASPDEKANIMAYYISNSERIILDWEEFCEPEDPCFDDMDFYNIVQGAIDMVRDDIFEQHYANK